MREDEPVSTIIDELSWRGLIAQSTDLDALRAATAAGPVTLYCGFDPTAPSLHLGNLVQILTVRRFQQHGHRPLALVGGATGLIGDPKETGERTLNPREVGRGLGAADPRAAGQVLRLRGAERRGRGEQPRLDRGPVGAGVPPRRRQALQRQPDARPRGRRRAPGQGRHLLHGVQLPVAPVLRLRPAATGVSAARCRRAAPTSGATSSRASTSSGAWRAAARTRSRRP